MSKQEPLERIPVDSKLIEYMVYDRNTEVLEVMYKGGPNKGKQKKYKDFSAGALDHIVNHKSPGAALVSVLRKREKKTDKKNIFQRLLQAINMF
jgi:hypothetical protein